VKKQLAILAGLCLTLGGCVSGAVSASNIKPATENIRARHDAYVNADPMLSQAAKEQYLRESRWLDDALSEAVKP
jgi:hypothetical protein